MAFPDKDESACQCHCALFDDMFQQTVQAEPSFSVVDEIIDEALKSHSPAEQDQAFQDMNAVSTAIEETEELLMSSLFQLEAKLNEIPQKNAYMIAYQQNRDFVCDVEFRLMFLRAKRFDAKKAAECIVKHMELKLKLWGLALLTRRITFNDLDAESQQVFANNGAIQILPVRDSAGRVVFFSMEKNHRPNYRTDTPEVFVSRLLWYYLMAVMEDDVESQKNGIVYVAYSLGNKPAFDDAERKVLWGAGEVSGVCPIRITSFLYCYDQPSQKALMDIFAVGLQITARCRFQPIFGSDTECKHKMMTLGIPVNHLPYDAIDDQIILNNNKFFNKWIDIRKRIEANPMIYKQDIKLLGMNDIVVDKGRNYQEHYGSKRFREFLVKEMAKFASSGTTLSKPKMARQIADKIAAGTLKMRFVKNVEKGVWRLATNQEMAAKVENYLRRLPKPVPGKLAEKPRLRLTDRDLVAM
eukprot:CAMPEP_0119548244 /NCGR_PEP_ID=MMETSP1352-20130426/2195_1 /TAXON_ID=265584 /ORGANISM="Stauroneis constricta, Strain CCMP1120" /LENGTH=468 /DNA_ID=CAMNT_0007593447 /DNA_START=172 /DNA_END=1578 /DNA_ORIENTATION=+